MARLALIAAAAWLLSGVAGGATIVFDPPEGSLLAAPPQASTLLPQRLTAPQLAVIVNTADPLSVAIGDYYARRRHIPKTNVIRVRFDPLRDDLPENEFTRIRAFVESRVGATVQAYALTWARPYRVGCMSITAAFAFGFDAGYCATGCNLTRLSPYFNSASTRPYADLKIRPAMSIAAVDFAHAQALIDRGIASDSSMPRGTAYLVSTDDRSRNVRATEYASADTPQQRVKIAFTRGDEVHDRNDVMFYFIGAAVVPAIDSNRFLPGAVADHLTSFGGMLTSSDSGQMSSLRWLEAGATGSYGTVVEPCNVLGKFPNVGILMSRYLAGETLIEAYWKSVLMPGQGVFVGEPLAAPFRRPPASR